MSNSGSWVSDCIPFNTCTMDMNNIGGEDVISKHWPSSGVMQHFSSGLTNIGPASWVKLPNKERAQCLKQRTWQRLFTSDTLEDWQNPHMVLFDDDWSETAGGIKSDAFEIWPVSWSSEFAVQMSLKSTFCNRFFCLLRTFWWFSMASEAVMSHFLFAACPV